MLAFYGNTKIVNLQLINRFTHFSLPLSSVQSTKEDTFCTKEDTPIKKWKQYDQVNMG